MKEEKGLFPGERTRRDLQLTRASLERTRQDLFDARAEILVLKEERKRFRALFMQMVAEFKVREDGP